MRNLFRGSETPEWLVTAVIGLLACFVLFFRLGDSGFWDPWEMNQEIMARNAGGPAKVLVFASDAGKLASEIKEQTQGDQGIEFSWLRTSTKPKEKTLELSKVLTQAKSKLSATGFHALIIPLGDLKESDDDDPWTAFAKEARANLPGSLVFLIGASEQAVQAFEEAGMTVSQVEQSESLMDEWAQVASLPKVLMRVRSSKGVFGVPPLRFWLVNLSHSVFGQSEFSSRLPSALLGLLVLIITFILARAMAGPWAGVLAVLVLLGTPYLTVQARSMGGETGLIAYLALGVWGLHQLFRKKWVWSAVLITLGFIALLLEKGLFGPSILALLALGLTLMTGRRDKGLLWSSLIIWLALAVCFVLVLSPNFFGDSDLPSWRSNLVAVLIGTATLLTSLAVYWSMSRSKDMDQTALENERNRSTFALWGALVSWVLTVIAAGALLRSSDWSFVAHLRATSHPFEGGPGAHDRGFDFFMLQTGFAFLPWIILVPFALGRLVQEEGEGERSRNLILLWAAVPFVVLCASILHLGHSVYPGGPAFAVAIAVYASYLHRKKEFTALHVLFILLGLYLLRTELKLSPHPLVGTVTWDPSFVFAFKEIHRGVLYPESLAIPGIYRGLCLLFIAWLAFSAIKGSRWMERVRELSRSSRFYFFVLGSLLFLSLIAPVVSLLSYVQGNASLMGGESAYRIIQQIPVVIIGTPPQLFLLLFLVAYSITGITRSRWALSRLYPDEGASKGVMPGALRGLGFLPDKEGGMVQTGAKVSTVIGGVALLIGALALIFSASTSGLHAFSEVLRVPVLCLSLVSLSIYSILRRTKLAPAEALIFWGSLVLLWGACSLHGAGNPQPAFSILAMVWALVVFTRLWPLLFHNSIVRRSTLVLGILLFGLQILLGLAELTDDLAIKSVHEGALGVQQELGAAFVWRPELAILFAIVCWSLLGWIRMGLPIAEKIGANRLIMGLALLFMLCALYLVLGASLSSSAGVSQILSGILWIPLLLLVILIGGVFMSIRPQIEDWKSQFVSLTQKVESTQSLFIGLVTFSLMMSFVLLFKFIPQLSHHVSQKHLISHYQSVESSSEVGKDIFRYGQFSSHTGEDNLYASEVPSISDTATVLKILDSKKDVHVKTGLRAVQGERNDVFVPVFDAANDVDSDGVRDWDTDWGVADSIEKNVLVDGAKSWRKDQWKGWILMDGTARVRKSRVVTGNTATELSFKGPPMLRKPGAPDNWYVLDHPDAKNHNASSMEESRSYVVFPVRDFSELNFKYRRKNKGKQIPVLDNRSSRQLLLASSLKEGEEDQNWQRDLVLTQEEFDAIEGVQEREIVFDDKIVLIGIKFEEDMVWRTKKARITFFFKVKAGLAKSWKLFVHVDRVGGARLGADHWVANLATSGEEKNCTGCFKSNHWIVGDIIADTFEVDIPMAHAPGLHHVNMGFYDPNASQRLRITEVKAPTTHNGDHRVRVGSFVVR